MTNEEVSKWLDAERKSVPLEDDEFWLAIPYDQRLRIAEYIFRACTRDPLGSFRHLVYCKLGFTHDAYSPLYTAGGMAITNAMHDYDNTVSPTT